VVTFEVDLLCGHEWTKVTQGETAGNKRIIQIPTRWQDAHTTFFYSEPYLVPRDPKVASKIRNALHFCPPRN
jgi:hypothetical protein